MCPHNTTVIHTLYQADCEAKLNFMHRKGVFAGEMDSTLLWFSDKSFKLRGYMSSHNNNYWFAENSTLISEVPLHYVKVYVWGVKCSTGIIGPIFF
jgi:hypothetical protein